MGDGPIAMLPVRIPRGQIDGAVVELAQQDDGIITADIRIPAPAARVAHECEHQASNFTPCRICGA